MGMSERLSKAFSRIFKPWSIPRPLLIAMPFLVALIVAIFSQYVVTLPVKGSSALPSLIVAGIVFGLILGYKFRSKKMLGVGMTAAVVIGFFLVPYFSFFLGRMNLYAVDQMPEGFTVKEMRITFDKVAFVKSDNTEVTAWSGMTITLRPGTTRVHLGVLNLPAGNYIGRRIYMNNVDIDVEADIARMVDPETGQSPAPEAYENVYASFQTDFDSDFKNTFPQGGAKNWSALDGSKFTFTMSTGQFPQPEFEPETMDYPGIGGPDITLDFTLSSDGTVVVTPIIDMPPGFPAQETTTQQHGPQGD